MCKRAVYLSTTVELPVQDESFTNHKQEPNAYMTQSSDHIWPGFGIEMKNVKLIYIFPGIPGH